MRYGGSCKVGIVHILQVEVVENERVRVCNVFDICKLLTVIGH